MKKKKTGKLPQIILGVGILVVFVTFIMYGIEVFVPSPEHENFCEEKHKQGRAFTTREACETDGGLWHEYYPAPTKQEGLEGYCDAYYTCNKNYQEALEQNQRTVLFITSLIGVITLILGVFLTVQSVAYGLMSGGILVFVIGVIRAWSLLSKYVQFALFGVLLALLIWFSYKKFGK